MLYEKKVRYLDHYEGGVRVGGSGFAKIEVLDSSLRMDLTVKGLHPTDSFTREVLLCGGGKEAALGTIVIEGGTGTFRHVCRIHEQIDKTGIAYEEWSGIRIFLGGSREISSRWEPLRKERRTSEQKDVSREIVQGRASEKLSEEAPAGRKSSDTARKAEAPSRKASSEEAGTGKPDAEKKEEAPARKASPEENGTRKPDAEKREGSLLRYSPTEENGT